MPEIYVVLQVCFAIYIEPSLYKSKFLDTYSNNGQNLWADASTNSSVDWSDIKHIGAAIDSWYAEKDNVAEDVIRSYKYHE